MNLNSLSRLAIVVFALLCNGAALAATLTWVGGDADFPLRWNTTDTNWDAGAGSVVWTQGSDALFNAATGGTVVITGGVMTANSISNTAGVLVTVDRGFSNNANRILLTGDALVSVSGAGELRLPQVTGTNGLKLTGGGLLSLSQNAAWTGGTTVLSGTFQHQPPAATGPVTLLDTAGAGNARLYIRGVNSSWTMSNDVVVQAGSTGIATVENSPTTGGTGVYAPTISGNLTLDRALTVKLTGVETASITLSGAISGAGALILEGHSTNAQSFIISGDASAHTGGMVLTTNPTNKTLVLDGTFGSSNILVGNGVAIAGSGTLAYNVVGDSADLIDRGTGGSLDLTGLTLMPLLSGTQTQDEYVLADSVVGLVGPFANIVNYGNYTFGVEYAGTELNPGMVVLTVKIPEPATATMLALAGLAGLRRRPRGRA